MPITDRNGEIFQSIADYHNTSRIPSQKYLEPAHFPALVKDFKSLDGGNIGSILDTHTLTEWQGLVDFACSGIDDQYFDDDIRTAGDNLDANHLTSRPKDDYLASAEALAAKYGKPQDKRAIVKVLLFCWIFDRLAGEFPDKFFDPVFVDKKPAENPSGKTYTLRWDVNSPLTSKVLLNSSDSPVNFRIKGKMLEKPREITLPPQCSFNALFTGEYLTCLKGILAANVQATTSACRYYRTEHTIYQAWNYENSSNAENFLNYRICPEDFAVMHNGALVVLGGGQILSSEIDSAWLENLGGQELLSVFCAGRQCLALDKDGKALSNVNGITGAPVVCAVEYGDELLIISRKKEFSRRRNFTDSELAEILLDRFLPLNLREGRIIESVPCGGGFRAGVTEQGSLIYFRKGE